MKSTKAPKVTLKPKKKIRKLGNKRPDLAEQYREVQWLRGLVAYFERAQRKPERN